MHAVNFVRTKKLAQAKTKTDLFVLIIPGFKRLVSTS